jgi:hypothetical protein
MRLASRSVGLRFDLYSDFIGLAFCNSVTFLNCTDRSCLSLCLYVTNFVPCLVAKKSLENEGKSGFSDLVQFGRRMRYFSVVNS